MTEAFTRDFVGYGAHPPDPQWLGGARIAVQFVVNYEEGGEHNVMDGDAHSEVFLLETPGGRPIDLRFSSMPGIHGEMPHKALTEIIRFFEQRRP